jgi:acetyl-CoA synthetase
VASIIEKPLTKIWLSQNLELYQQSCSSFSWSKERSLVDGLPAGGLNIAHEAVDRHARSALKDKLAIRWLGKDGTVVDISYERLQSLTSQFANVLHVLGVEAGKRVFVLAGRIPELYISVLGALKHGCVASPLFSAFGPEPIQTRLSIGQASVLVTTTSLYRKKVAAIRAGVPSLEHVLIVPEPDDMERFSGTIAFPAAMQTASPDYRIAQTDPQQPALLHFTSGTTGKPKGALHVHEAVVAHLVTGRYALDFHPNDVFWCTADPGWVTGTSYGIVSPLANGITSIVDESDFDAERWYDILEREKVSVWYTAPTAVRMMMKGGSETVRRRNYPSLRFIASVGEPLNPQAVLWGQEAFGLPIHDNWWQTETGGIMIANYLSMPIKPGSMGRPLPGIEAGIVRRLPEGGVEAVTEADVQGELALRSGWPSMFRAYLGEEERYRKCFADGWYLTGDLARRDADGYFWFVGRGDDVIKSSGHLIGPFEVESSLMEHPAVAEAGVIGKPDPVAHEVVKAFVALRPGFSPSPGLQRELLAFVRKRLGTAVAPKEIDFIANLPKTRSGKIMRRLLKARELGLPEGDTSTLEADK